MRQVATAAQHHAQDVTLVNLMTPTASVVTRVIVLIPHPHGVVSGMVIARCKGQLRG